ncbi:probable 7-methylxanthine methyltransferase 5 [Haliotis rubra]|uniref:probable 7-methylxanthine methyltransferase 5 n=1 Tax=Haliotis rubra TaxID=36100 RepID=UPI001EE5ABFC|nr:probable 7-methylxanthine methyltransferase 5 [Haliotis rubra]XP_046557223.1 probable 7-methylxanthine methyltransferase 5 [Haliotis rubra]
MMSIRFMIRIHLRLHKVPASVPVRYCRRPSKAYEPYGKIGSGNHGSTLAKQTSIYTDPVRDRILNRAKAIPFTAKDSVFNIGDYGAADGSASMVFIGQLLATLKDQHGPDTQFQIIYEDTEVNDFNSLFKRMSGTIPDSPSYLLEKDNVYVLASGTDFYKQCVPSNSMHFIMCMISVHWLSKTPVKYNDSVYKYPESSTEEKMALDRQAEVDLDTFLLLRSREMKQGGLLVICVGCEFEDMNSGEVKYTVETMITLLTETWKEFRDSGKITKDEFVNTNFSICLYKMDQLRKPFDDKLSAVSQSGLCLLSAETVIIPDIFYTTWKEKKDKEGIDDREEFARLYVAAHRNWSNSTFMNGLSDSRSREEKEKIVADLYDRVEKRMSMINPEEIKDDLQVIFLVITRE